MGYTKIPTSRGYALQKDNGEMAGSVGFGKTNIPTIQKPRPTTLRSEPDPEPAWGVVPTMYERFQEHHRQGGTVDSDTMTTTPHEEIAFALALSIPTDMDDVQRKDVYRMLNANIAKYPPAEPTDEQWNEWLEKSRARLENPDLEVTDTERARLLQQLAETARGPKPDAKTFAAINKVDGRMWGAKFSLDEQYKQIASWYDTSPNNVKWQVEKYRREYFEALENGEQPEIDEQYARGYKGHSGIAPKDEATIYGMWKADNPELYDPPAVPQRYVAFDLETTGREVGEHSIIQIGLVEYDQNGVETRRFVSYVRPPKKRGVYYTGDDGAVGVHGILPEHVEDAPTFRQILPTIKDYFGEDVTVIGQNVIDFDARHLEAEVLRVNGGNKSEARKMWTKAADTYWHAKRHISGLSDYKLSTLVQHFGLGPFNAHDAGDDAAVTAELYFAMRKPLKDRQIKAAKERAKNDPWVIK